MKKIIATLTILSALAVVSSYGQGTVGLNNTGGTRISTNSVVGGAATGFTAVNDGTAVNSFYYALFWSTAQTTVGGTQTGAISGTNGVYAFNAAGWNNGSVSSFSTNTSAGRFVPSAPNSDTSASVSGLAGGTSAQFVIIGWSGNIGNTITAVQNYLANPTQNGWVGESLVSGPFAPGTLGSTPAATIIGAAYPNIPGFTLGLVTPSVPEPTTLALAVLGFGSLLALRRKK
jgi:hypothetical protein